MSYSFRKSSQKVIFQRSDYLKLDVSLHDKVAFIPLQDKRKTKTQKNCFVAGQKIKTDPAKEERLLDRLQKITQLKHELLTPYLGYTVDSPHVLFMPIIEDIYGDLKPPKKPVKASELEIRLLYDFIKENSEESNDMINTQKSIFALCIANAMLYLHENGIVHQNLQLKTIKMAGEVGNELPHLMYYGLTEFEQASPSSSSKRYLPPELRNGQRKYSKETDVFQFGLLLCELYEEKIHHKNTKPEIIKAIETPLGALIQKCLDEDPAKRPTFADIYEGFRRNETLFPNTKLANFSKVLDQLNKFDDKRFNSFFRPVAEINDPDFIVNVYKYAGQVTPRNATNFFNIIGNFFNRDTNINVFNALLTVSQKLVQNPKFCASFIEAQLHQSLPFNQKELCQKALNITYWIIQYEPDAIADISDVLIFLMSKVPECTHKILVLLNIYQKKFNLIEEPCIFLDKVLVDLKNNKKLLFQTGFISIFYDLCKNFKAFRNKRLTNCVDAVSSCISSKKSSVVRAVYAFLAEFKDIAIPNKRSFYSYAPIHLVNPHTAIQAVKFLLIRDDFRITQKLITSSFRLATRSNYANLLLCKIADTEEGSTLLMQPENMNFIELPLPDYEGTLRILLILLRNQQNLQKYKESKALPFFVTKLCENSGQNLRIIRYLENLICIIDPDTNFIYELEENEFCDHFYKTVINSPDDGIIENALMIFGRFSLNCPKLDFFPLLTENLLRDLKDKSNDRFKRAVITLFANLSAIKACCKIFIENKFNPEVKFKNLITKDSNLSRAAEIYKNNIVNYNQKKKAVALQKRAELQSKLNTAQKLSKQDKR